MAFERMEKGFLDLRKGRKALRKDKGMACKHEASSLRDGDTSSHSSSRDGVY